MKFYGPEDLENGNFEKFWQKIEEFRMREDARRLKEEKAPEFNTIEEALDYYHKRGALTWEEFENKLREKYKEI